MHHSFVFSCTTYDTSKKWNVEWKTLLLNASSWYSRNGSIILVDPSQVDFTNFTYSNNIESSFCKHMVYLECSIIIKYISNLLSTCCHEFQQMRLINSIYSLLYFRGEMSSEPWLGNLRHLRLLLRGPLIFWRHSIYQSNFRNFWKISLM